jgi:plastocyanin
VYYYGNDGFRYVFGSDKVYFTWYSNFDGVKWLTDNDLAMIQIGGNATYRPGVKMIKIDSDPKTYAVGQGGTLHWVTSEAVAIALYGATWNKKIDDVQDSSFSNYKIGSDITSASQFVPASVTASVPSINVDKGLTLPTTINITASAYSPEAVTINAGGTVKWTNADTQKHAVTSDDLSWGSGTMVAGDTFVKRFNTAGVYTYFDSYNSKLTGTVTVH